VINRLSIKRQKEKNSKQIFLKYKLKINYRFIITAVKKKWKDLYNYLIFTLRKGFLSVYNVLNLSTLEWMISLILHKMKRDLNFIVITRR